MRRVAGIVCSVALLFVIGVGFRVAPAGSGPTVYLLTGFEGAHCSENTASINASPLLGYSAFYGGVGNPSLATVSCATDLKETQTHSRVARIEYDVTSPGSYSGFWMQWAITDFAVADWGIVSFDVRGCDAAVPGDCVGQGATYRAFTSRLKVELKIKGWGWKTTYIDGVTNKWQRYEIPLATLVDTTWAVGPSNQFVVTFEEREATADRGMIYVDNIAFEKRRNG